MLVCMQQYMFVGPVFCSFANCRVIMLCLSPYHVSLWLGFCVGFFINQDWNFSDITVIKASLCKEIA